MNKIKSNSGSATQVVIIAMGIVFTIIFTISMYISTQIKTSMSAKDYIERNYLAQAGIESSIALASQEITSILENIESKDGITYSNLRVSYVDNIMKGLSEALELLDIIEKEEEISLDQMVDSVTNAKSKVDNINQSSTLDRDVRDIISDCLKFINSKNSSRVNKLMIKVIENLSLAVDNISVYKMSMHTHEIVNIVDDKITNIEQYNKLIHKELVVNRDNNISSIENIFYIGTSGMNLNRIMLDNIGIMAPYPEIKKVFEKYDELFKSIGTLWEESGRIAIEGKNDITSILKSIDDSLNYLDEMKLMLYESRLVHNIDIDKVIDAIYNAKNVLNEIKCKLGIFGSSTGEGENTISKKLEILYNEVKYENEEIKLEDYDKLDKNIKVTTVNGKIIDVDMSELKDVKIDAKGIEGDKTYTVESIVDFINIELNEEQKYEVNYKIKSYKKLNKTGG